MIELFEAARRVSVPLVAVHTADPFSTVKAISQSVNNENAVFQWDAAAGMVGVNDLGKSAMKGTKPDELIGFVEAMVFAKRIPPGSVLVALNAHRQVTSPDPGANAAAIQSVLNLRNEFKTNFRMLVMASPAFTLPADMASDVVVLTEPLPAREQLKTEVVEKIFKLAQKATPGLADQTPDAINRQLEALVGLSQFAAEQVFSMSLTTEGVDMGMIWERKRVAIEQTPGLKVWRGTETFDDIVGCESIKKRLRLRLHARKPVGVVVWLDEIDKVFANIEGDTSGVRMDQFKTMLTEMEDQEWEGALLAGLQGGGKSLIAKAFGNEAGVPTISLDLAAMEDKMVGESEARLRYAINVIKSVGGGNAYFIATSNNATIMRPELQRRFTGGFFWFDVLTQEEQSAAWAFYTKKYGLKKQPMPDYSLWSGAEIRNCCREAWNCGITLKDAAEFIIPVAQARADEVEAMRRYAHGRYLDASKPGKYVYTSKPMEQPLRGIMMVGNPAAIAGMKES